jgi:hypothetical protein
LYSEKFHNILSSLRVIKAIKEGMGGKENACSVFVGKPDETDHSDLGVHGTTILKRILKKQDARGWTDSCGSGKREDLTTKRVENDVSMLISRNLKAEFSPSLVQLRHSRS